MEAKEDGRNFIIGAVVGIASILPGVSGGLIAVLCGVYERLIEDISRLREKLFSDFRFLLALGLGLVFGMLACTLVLDYTLDAFALPCMAFFFGLIFAQIPEVYNFSREDGTEPKPVHWIWAAVGFLMCVGLMMLNSEGTPVDVDDHSATNFLLFMLCGIVLAVSKIMPGISGSSLLIAMGMFEVTISSVAHLEMFFIVSLGIGLLIGLFGFAKVMDRCLKNYRKHTYMLILGLTLGSLMIILGEVFGMHPQMMDWVIVAVMIVAGVIVSYGFTYYGKKLRA